MSFSPSCSTWDPHRSLNQRLGLPFMCSIKKAKKLNKTMCCFCCCSSCGEFPLFLRTTWGWGNTWAQRCSLVTHWCSTSHTSHSLYSVGSPNPPSTIVPPSLATFLKEQQCLQKKNDKKIGYLFYIKCAILYFQISLSFHYFYSVNASMLVLC